MPGPRRSIRRVGARSPRTTSITYRDGCCGPSLGCRGTTRGTSAGRISVQCMLSGHCRVTSAQVERPERPSSPLLIRGFRVRAPGAPPAKTPIVDLVSWDECLVPPIPPTLPAREGIRSRKVTASRSVLPVPAQRRTRWPRAISAKEDKAASIASSARGAAGHVGRRALVRAR
jgi:hypothetical protein